MSDGSDQQLEQRRPLAARVLGGLQAKEQAWVRSHIEKWSKGGWVGGWVGRWVGGWVGGRAGGRAGGWAAR